MVHQQNTPTWITFVDSSQVVPKSRKRMVIFVFRISYAASPAACCAPSYMKNGWMCWTKRTRKKNKFRTLTGKRVLTRLITHFHPRAFRMQKHIRSSSSLQNDLPLASRERPPAALPVGHAAWDPGQCPGEPDDQFQFVSLHCSQHALGSRSSL